MTEVRRTSRKLRFLSNGWHCSLPIPIAPMRLLLCVVGAALALQSCKLPERSTGLLLACTTHRDQIMDVIRLEPGGRAAFLSGVGQREGTFTASESQYDVIFPERHLDDNGKPLATMRLHLSINRYTGRFTREVGRAPHDGVTGILPWTGVCEPYKKERL
jgi:hypothetical protein